ncbi:alpha/beta-hydrolase [Leucogyrophana mollusca]|uniref:Alpha/beta-hydrolase n=1 Tax=Leucogyrophana mollusca TaxID=85980 RepID=A0ACB8BT77_9AGAM|nr:alpha/beta-hydrolase [Leucogyrophana mollusca]
MVHSIVTLENTIRLSTHVQLELATCTPNPAARSSKLAVCLHPWSWLGGNMHDPVIHLVVRLLQKKNYHVVYYNSRGVGKSTGMASLTGRPEADDLKALVNQTLEEMPHIDSVTIIATRTFQGYSYGALIASLQPVLSPPIKTSHVLLSYPLSPRGLLTLFNTKTYASAISALLREPTSNLLIVFGENDEFTSKSKYDAWAKLLKEQEPGKAALEIVSIPGASHFWRATEEQRMLEETLENWLS